MIDILNKADCKYCNKPATHYRLKYFIFYCRLEHYCSEHMALIKREKHINLTFNIAKHLNLTFKLAKQLKTENFLK